MPARRHAGTVVRPHLLVLNERDHANRPAFVGMLSRRIATVRDHP